MLDAGDTGENVAEVDDSPICCCVGDPVLLQLFVVEEYKEAPYVGLPPVQPDAKVTCWPASIVGLDGLMDGTERSGLTVTMSFDDVFVTGVDAESVMLMQ